MNHVKVILDGQPSGVLPDVVLKDDGVRVPLDAFCASIGAKVEVRGGQTVVCSEDLCVPVETDGETGGSLMTSLSVLSEALGLRWDLLKESGELRVTTQRMPLAEVGLRTGDFAPDFTLPDLSGRSVSLRDFRGHRAAFYVWASW